MEQANLEQFKKMFLEMKKNYLDDNIEDQFFRGSEVKLGTKGDEVDVVQVEQERELMLKLKGRKQFYLKKVDSALERIMNGEFGHCEECGENIDEQRLFARPTATHCIGCKEIQEQEERHMLYEKRSHTLGRDLGNKNSSLLPFNQPERDEGTVEILEGKLLPFHK